MMEAECPWCGNEVDLDDRQLPDSACNTRTGSCPSCDSPVVFGWYATATMEKAAGVEG